jgi:protein-tyrosine phosphatase
MMIDIHSHILPGLDDGAKNWAATLKMCRQSQADGVTHIVATPHANFEYAYSRESHLRLLDELRARVPGMQFSLGCDFHLSTENVRDALRNPNRYTINSSRYVLVELSNVSPAFSILDHIFPMLQAGFVPIVTHPERNAVIVKNLSLVEKMVCAGCLVQVTANSLTGYWGSTAKLVGMRLIKEGLAHLLASDTHDTKRRTPILSAGLKAAARVVGETEARKLVWENAKRLVDCNPIDIQG